MLHDIKQPIESLPSTSFVTIKRLKSIGINTYWDLLNYFPFRYENYSLISPINRLQIGEVVTIRGKIIKTGNVFTKRGFKIQKVVVSDNTGKIDVNWFNQSYLLRILKPGMTISIAGEVKFFGNTKTLEPRDFEIIKDNGNDMSIHTGRIVPIYSEKNGLSSKTIREKIWHVKNTHACFLREILPNEIISFNNLIDEQSAYQNIHFPESKDLTYKSRERLAFDELFIIQLSAAMVKKDWEKEKVGNMFSVETQNFASLQNFINSLPFKLTTAQRRVVNEIINDLKKSQPMNRFLEGDVGSGKTVVAAIAAYLSYLNGFQTLFMAPTEILANQHYQTLKSLFTNDKKISSVRNGFKPFPTTPTIGLQTGSNKAIDKIPRSRKNVNKNNFDILVGTHALISKKLSLQKVGLVIIDEQHRFGVAQRALLKEKGLNPHLLTMTATPIPRTMAMTIFGELDLSVIDEMPKGRIPIKTFLVPREKRESGYGWIKEQINKYSIQVFTICPLIEESDIETMQSVKAATKEYERLKKDIFPEFKLGLLHGRIKSKEKNAVMKDFKDNKYDILVSTPVVEVGIDIANATIMLIEGAERFGLAQLHQLRGRVGRSDKQSYCLLYSESTDEKVIKRLHYFSKTQNGMDVAEYDLKMRGPGDIFGSRQHGYLNLKIASLSDFDLIAKSKKAVNYFMNKYSDLKKFEEIKNRLKEYRVKQISRD